MYRICDDENLNKTLQEIAKTLPKIEYEIKYFLVLEYLGRKKIRHKFNNIDDAISMYKNSPHKKKLYVKISNLDRLVNFGYKPNLKYTMSNKTKPFSLILYYHLTWHDSEKNGDCFDEDFSNDILQLYDLWVSSRDVNRMDYTKLWVYIEGIGHIEIKEGDYE